jgi:hypothetical protein
LFCLQMHQLYFRVNLRICIKKNESVEKLEKTLTYANTCCSCIGNVSEKLVVKKFTLSVQH